MDTKLLRQKILDLAIRGKLVPQDPNDEPASVLLEKTRAEKERLIKEKKIKPTKGKSDKSHYKKEVPFEVPESWEWTIIKSIGDVVTGSTPSKEKKEYYDGTIPFYKPTDLEQGINTNNSLDRLSTSGFSKARKLPVRSVLVTCIGATIGKTGLIKTEGACNQQINAIIPNLETVLPEYLFYFCISNFFQKEILENASATTLPIINKGNFEKLSIPLPPLSEQTHIVSQIESLFELIQVIEESKLSLEQYITQTKSKILDLAFRGKLVPQDSNEEPASTLLKQIKKRPHKITADKSHYQFEVPEGWVTCQLYKICDFERGVTFPSSAKQTLKRENTIACVRTANVQEQLELDDLWYIDKSFLKNNRKKLLRKSDIVISSANSKELVGKTSFVENINEEMCFGGFVMVIRTNFINNKFLFYYLRDCFYNGIFSKNASQTTNIANINTTILGNLVIKVPPLAEQQRIVNKIEEIFKILDIIQENLQTNV